MNKRLIAVIGLFAVLVLLAPQSSQATITKDAQAQEQDSRTLEGHSDRVLSVAFSPDGQTLASSSRDQPVILWRVSDGEQLRTLVERNSSGSACGMAFSPTGQMLASVPASSFYGGDYTVRLWRVSDGSLLHTHTTNGICSVAFSPDGQTLVAGSGDVTTLDLWRVSDGQLIRTFTGDTILGAMALSPDGQTLAASSNYYGRIMLWRVSDGQLIRTFTGGMDLIKDLAFSPDGQMLAASSEYYGPIELWRVSDGQLIRTFTAGPGEGVEYSVAFSPDGRTLASSGHRTIRLWLVSDGSLLRTLEGHTERVHSVAFSPDGQTLASGSEDKTVRLWDVSAIVPSVPTPIPPSPTSLPPIPTLLPPPTTPTTRPRVPTIQITDVSWVTPPVAYVPATLRIKGKAADLPQGSGYMVNLLVYVSRLKDPLNFWYDPQAEQAAPYISPSTLPSGDFEIQLSGISLPRLIHTKFAVQVLSTTDSNAVGYRPNETLDVGPSDQQDKACWKAILAVGSSALKVFEGSIDPSYLEKAKLFAGLTVKTIKADESAERCHGNDDCLAQVIQSWKRDIILGLLDTEVTKLGGIHGFWAVLSKNTIVAFPEITSCAEWYVNEQIRQVKEDFLFYWKTGRELGKLVSSVVVKSPAYPLIVDSVGRRTGFLPDGITVEEIPNSVAVQLEEKRMVIAPSESTEVQLSGYAQGTMTVFTFLTTQASGGNAVSAQYDNVPVSPGMAATINSNDAVGTLNIDSNRDNKVDQPRAPDSIVRVTAESPPKPGTDATMWVILSASLGVVILILLAIVGSLILTRKRVHK